MNIGINLKNLMVEAAEQLKKTEEYAAMISAKAEAEKDPQTGALLREFERRQMALYASAGHETEELARYHEQLCRVPVLLTYFNAVSDFSKLLEDFCDGIYSSLHD